MTDKKPPKSPRNPKAQTARGETGGTTELLANTSGVVDRQLADQLSTVFVVGLLTLWLVILKSGRAIEAPVERDPWWYFLIFSILVLLLWWFWVRKKVRHPRLRWVLPCMMIGFIWLIYWISGVSFPTAFFIILTAVLFIWAVVLLLALLLIRTRWGQNKLGKAITWCVLRGDHIYSPLSFLVLFTSVLQGWKSLHDAGATGWWMYALLLVGVLMSAVVALVRSWPSHSESES